MSRKNLSILVPVRIPARMGRRIAALGLAAALALPGAALARPERDADAGLWAPLWSWLVDLVSGVPAATPAAAAGARLRNTSGKAGSTVDPDGLRRGTLLLSTDPTAPVPTDPAATGTATVPLQ
jgi:hypothetical protein